MAQPILDRLAAESGELVRLSVIDGESLVWVGVAQGATGGLRYDPGREQGVVVHLASSAGGTAWLSTMSDEEALMAVSRQGLAADAAGRRARTRRGRAKELLARLAAGAGAGLRGGDRQLSRRHGGDGGAGAADGRRGGRVPVDRGAERAARTRTRMAELAPAAAAGGRGDRGGEPRVALLRGRRTGKEGGGMKAIVTGASDGIGGAVALRLAADCAARGEALELVLTASGRKPAPQALLDRAGGAAGCGRCS